MRANLNLILLLCVMAQSARGDVWSGRLLSTLGTNLRAEAPNTSLTLEPTVTWSPGPALSLEAYAAVDRPTDPYENFSVSEITLSLLTPVFDGEPVSFRLRTSLTFPDADRWSTDGGRFRPSLLGEFTTPTSREVRLMFRAGPYWQASQYRQFANGMDVAQFGFTERLLVVWQKGRWLARFRLSAEQRFATVWKNDFATMEHLGFELTTGLVVGLGHELLSSLVDDSTGRYGGLRLFDSRESRLSLFVDWRS